ncbi:MAG: hypothetical protein ACR2GN_06805 [Bacteroidia bacterium]
MKTYLLDIFPKIQVFSKKLDDLTILKDQHWVSINDLENKKMVYIFRDQSELLISTNGKIKRQSWEYIGNKTIILNIENESLLFKNGFVDRNIMALKLDGSNEYAIFVNENQYDGELNSLEKVIEFLKREYLSSEVLNTFNNSREFRFEENDNTISKLTKEEQEEINRKFEESIKKKEEITRWVIIGFFIICFIYIILSIWQNA